MDKDEPVVIITGPSGSGKTTILKELASDPRFKIPRSLTTRERRKGEDSEEYIFTTVDNFLSIKHAGDLIEWEEVYPGTYYGTMYSEFFLIWEIGKIPVLVMDFKGAMTINGMLEDRCLVLYLDAGSEDDLESRLIDRGDTPKEEIKIRKERYKEEIKASKNFNCTIYSGGPLEDTMDTVWFLLDKHL